jgi:hypothetical protein
MGAAGIALALLAAVPDNECSGIGRCSLASRRTKQNAELICVLLTRGISCEEFQLLADLAGTGLSVAWASGSFGASFAGLSPSKTRTV